ncbi:MAG: glycoside hydrolase family 1 protein [Candidatus Sericytochromatia bacterium]|nr:glycoside hydrolase family 1 protein [Candidatus Tanganyikabacteria bacterium]
MIRRAILVAALAGSVLAGCGTALPGFGGAGTGATRANRVHLGGAFPKGFLWGVATAGYQSEGGDEANNWHAWQVAGKFPSPVGKAVDFWNRYAEDFDLAKGMGLNAFRMSVEWSRIEPKPGQIDRASLDRYKGMIDAAVARGLEPVVTLNHFVYPAWLDTRGGASGWERPEAPERFAAFSRLVATELKGKVRTWLTINEPNVLTVGGFASGQIPPGRYGYGPYSAAAKGLVAAHRAAYKALHDVDPQNRVSTNVFYYYSKAGTSFDPLQLWGTDIPLTTQTYLDWPGRQLTGFPGPYLEDFGAAWLDYLAIDYYWGMAAKTMFNVRKAYNWPVSPAQLTEACVDLYKRYGKPIMIAENGLATKDLGKRDDMWTREAFLVHHLYYLREAIGQGVPVMGYMHWSLTDNYEWGDYAPRFGLYSVDARNDPTLARVPTPAVDVYRQIAESNSLPSKLVWTYMGLGF